MPEGTAVASVPFCFGIAQKGERSQMLQEKTWVLFPPTECPYHQNFSYMKRDTFFSSLPTLVHSFAHISSSRLMQERWYPGRQNSGSRKDIEIRIQVWIHRGNGCFCFPFCFSPGMIWCGSSFSIPVCLSSAGGCSYRSPAPCSQLDHCVMKEDLLPAFASVRTEIIADGGCRSVVLNFADTS